jgi:hypothetical protein
MIDFKGEKLAWDLKIKEVFNYIDAERGINIISQERCKKI